MSDSWVRDRMQAGYFLKPGTTAEEYVEAYLAFRLKKFTDAVGGEGLDLNAERARLAREQADEKAMDNTERRKELASLPDMTVAVAGVISLAVSRLMQVPALVSRGDGKLRDRIETAIVDALSAARVEEARSGAVDDEGASEDEGDDEADGD